MRVLGISGSLRRDSLNSALLRAAAERLPAGAELVEFDRLREVPPYDEDVETEGTPAVVEAPIAAAGTPLRALLPAGRETQSSAFLSWPGIEWLYSGVAIRTASALRTASRSASTGMFGAVWAQAELRKVLGALGGRVIETELPVARAKELLVDGHLELSPQQSEQLEELLAELVAAAEAEAELAIAA